MVVDDVAVAVSMMALTPPASPSHQPRVESSSRVYDSM
jgi:hypothetical protein